MKRFLASKGFTKPSVQLTPAKTTAVAHTTSGLQPKYTVPPVPHPCPHDHIALLVTKEGLLLRPHVPGLNHPGSHVRIAWGKEVNVEHKAGDGENEGADWADCVIVYGIVGILELFSGSYLLVITSKLDVGHLFDLTHAVYGVKGVTAIPLVEDRARVVVDTLAARNAAMASPSLLASNTMDTIGANLSSDADERAQESGPHVKFAAKEDVQLITPLDAPTFNLNDDDDASSGTSTPSEDLTGPSSVAKLLATRLSFWSRLSKRAPSLPPTPMEEIEPMLTAQTKALDSMSPEGKAERSDVLGSILAAMAPTPISSEERHSELEAKIVKECIREFTKGGMYFAYNFDITRSLQHKQEESAKSQRKNALLADLNALDEAYQSSSPAGSKVHVLTEPYPTLPLWRRVDRQFWWNEWLAKPFVDAGLHSYVLPIMQGYYQTSSFHIPREPVPKEEEESALIEYVIVSRRSRDRAGLRYQRRGVDDEAHVANFVETETIMRVEREGVSNVFSYVQLRGSVPLFWTQSSYGLKPPPQLSPERTHIQNLDAMRRHFQKTVPRYGHHSIVNLAEQHGKEAAITQGYRKYVSELNWKDVQYHEYDFHAETKGMKYENISKLVDTLERAFESQGYLWISDNTILSMQKGVFRVNCIDCLDRTNVVQSAFARNTLNHQLGAVALWNISEEDKTEMDFAFNDVWANNGDAISRAYAGTSALKGDFTRTGKRDLGGLLNDGVNSLARMYTSTFSDWFCQAVIDFMLGQRTLSVFSEFLLKLQSTDPRELIRLSKIRAEAIATSVSRVLSEGERLLSGWTLFAPEDLDTKMGDKFEEKVLLLTAQALYIISFDYTLEKVKIYTRVPLGDIIGLTKGAYILSPLEEASRDPTQNAGFLISWNNSNQTSRISSYSVRNNLDGPSSLPSSPVKMKTFSVRDARNGLSSAFSRNATVTALSNILSKTSLLTSTDTTFAAFKALPIDPARRRESSGGPTFTEQADELSGAVSCQQAVNIMVDSICRACEDMGNPLKDLVREADIVSLNEAQRMTSVYAKMEYGVKRLLWLGG